MRRTIRENTLVLALAYLLDVWRDDDFLADLAEVDHGFVIFRVVHVDGLLVERNGCPLEAVKDDVANDHLHFAAL